MSSRFINFLNNEKKVEAIPQFKQISLPNKPNMVNIDRLEDINQRISERNLPSSYLQQQFSSRPISTKYSMMPILDTRVKSSVPIIHRDPYNVHSTFNPGTSSPFIGYSSHINDESRLRNQFFALQKCEQSEYVPSSNSDLYMVHVSGGERKEPLLFNHLFQENDFSSSNNNNFNINMEIGKNLFENNTRIQLKDIPEKYSRKQHQTPHINRKL